MWALITTSHTLPPIFKRRRAAHIVDRARDDFSVEALFCLDRRARRSRPRGAPDARNGPSLRYVNNRAPTRPDGNTVRWWRWLR